MGSTGPNVSFNIREGHQWCQVAAAISANLTFVIAGTVLVWPSASVVFDENHENRIDITGDDYRWITLCTYFGQCFSPLIAGHIVDEIGRKYTLASTFFLFIFAWIITGLARRAWQLFIARLLGGLGIGVVGTVIPMYVGEIAEDSIRGCLVSVFQVMFSFGMGIEYAIGLYTSPEILCVLSCIFPILFILTFIWMPESPYYLMMKDRGQEAEKSLMILRGIREADDVKDELEMIQSLTTIQPKFLRQFRTLCTDKAVRRAILIVLAAVLFQDLSGILPILSFVSIIFRIPGKDMAEETTGAIVAAMQFSMSMCASLFIDRVGRKILYIGSCIVCCIALIAEGLFFFFEEDATRLQWMPVAFICIYLLAFPWGLGSVPLTLASEMFAMNMKGTALCVATIFSAATSLLSILIFDLLSSNEGEYLAFWICGIFCALGAGLMFYFLKETARKPLSEIVEDQNEARGESDTDQTRS